MRTVGRTSRNRFHLVTGIVLLTVASGCTSWSDYVHNGFKVGPNYCPPAAPVADHWIDDANPNVGSDPVQDAAWWQTFGDPVLGDLIQTAYRQNLSLRIAGWRIIEARAQRAIAAGNLDRKSVV
jgi:outer membrane protein TolC